MVYNGYDKDVCLLVTNNFHMLKLQYISYVGWLTKHQNDDFDEKKILLSCLYCHNRVP